MSIHQFQVSTAVEDPEHSSDEEELGQVNRARQELERESLGSEGGGAGGLDPGSEGGGMGVWTPGSERGGSW